MKITQPSASGPDISAKPWTYAEAFVRHAGLISADEQHTLARSRIAIAGMGGMGGIDAVTLARLGIGAFTIADPDVFDIPNTNRQYGASRSTLGHHKVDVMSAIIRDINPQADVRVFRDPLGPDNVAAFLDGANVFVDAMEFFEIDVRRLLFRRAAEQGLYAVTAGPVGFSAIWLVFAPKGMTFDRYFDLSDGMDQIEKVVAFAVGIAPKATQQAYMDLRAVDVEAKTGPSTALACHLAAGVMACEVLKILLQRGDIRAVPYYRQFDAYLNRNISLKLRGGNKHPLQRLKRWRLTRYFRRRGTL